MITPKDLPYKEIVFVDFEYNSGGNEGNPQSVVCMAAKELYSGKQYVLWRDELRKLKDAPFDVGTDTLIVAFYASAEWGCFLDLGWQMPDRVFDLYCEVRTEFNDGYPRKYSQLGIAKHYNTAHIMETEKTEMRDLILSGGPWSEGEKQQIMDYCLSDVVGMEQLFPCVINDMYLDTARLGQALMRGRYSKAVAKIERNGIPVNVPLWKKFKDNWVAVRVRLIEAVNQQYGVYEGTTFRMVNFERYLANNKIEDWPRLDSGKLSLSDKTFRPMADRYPQLRELYELRSTLSAMRKNKMPVGDDGRNRAMLSMLQSKTGRNQPSNSKHIFGPATWLRGLIKPGEGRAVVYLDWSSQEIALAAALSGDAAMLDSYSSGDPYIDFAKRIGMVPADATKDSHGSERQVCKAMVLGILYGMSAYGLAARAEISVFAAQQLLQQHRLTYPRFWSWSNNDVVNRALIRKPLITRLGWRLNAPLDPTAEINPRSLMNFPMQANGADMMRLAACVATEAGIKVCTPVHDAFLIESPISQLGEVVDEMTRIMEDVSEVIMGIPGFRCRVDSDIVAYPDHYSDKRGRSLWDKVMAVLAEIEAEDQQGTEENVEETTTYAA